MSLANCNFKEYRHREALVLENKIVYFGSSNMKGTLVLEKEGDSEELKVARKGSVFELKRGANNTASRVHSKGIFAFKDRNYKQVYIYTLETPKWSLFYPLK